MPTDVLTTRRQKVTYGRQANGRQSAKAAFTSLIQRTPRKPGSVLPSKRALSVASEAHSRATPSDTFDVPVSDDESDNTHRISPVAASRISARQPEEKLGHSNKSNHRSEEPRNGDVAATLLKRKRPPASSLQQPPAKRRSKENTPAVAAGPGPSASGRSSIHGRIASLSDGTLDTVTEDHEMYDDEPSISQSRQSLEKSVNEPMIVDSVGSDGIQARDAVSAFTASTNPATPRGYRKVNASHPSTPARNVNVSSNSPGFLATVTPRQRNLWADLLDNTIEDKVEDITDTTTAAQSPQNSLSSRSPKMMSPRGKNIWADLLSEQSPLPDTPTKQHQAASDISQNTGVQLTLRQHRVWDELFEEHARAPVEKMRTLHVKPQKPKAEQSRWNKNVKRDRLVDNLKTSTTSEVLIETSEYEQEPEERQPTENPDVNRRPTQITSASTHNQAFARPARRTYGQQRSHLAEPAQSLEVMLSQPFDVGLTPAKSKGAETSRIEQLQEDESDEGAVKSLQELRLAGDSRLFEDEMNTVLLDLSSKAKSALASKRSALMDLAEKLRDRSFRQRFIEGGYEAKVFKCFVGERDLICGVAVCFSTCLLLQHSSGGHSASYIKGTGTIRDLVHLLSINKDICLLGKERKTNMSKVAQQSLKQFTQHMREAFPGSSLLAAAITPQAVALQAIELLARRSREAGNIEDLLDRQAVTELVQIISELSSAHSGSHPEPATEATKAKLKLTLSILETSTIVPEASLNIEMWSSNLVGSIVQAGKQILESKEDKNIDLRCLVYRLWLNLSNNSEANSALFADSALLESVTQSINTRFRLVNETRSDAHFDELLLALGTLFNLAEMSGDTRALLSASPTSNLESLVLCFTQHLDKTETAESIADTQVNVAFGYLAVLLGMLCLNGKGRKRIQQCLPHGRIDKLVGAIEEFSSHHQKVDGEAGSEMWEVYTHRVRSVANALRNGTTT